ncbi:5'-methylthioadenosine nucleosidase [Desulfoluna butyratoxydans]|uniref:Nucleoside phosphorylase domain n=1 Tax=Desulfoluna butyratoxydans TaxID=231438 RepID=A0A4U8YPI4_9BACT|nr:5'-methylthioadenosine nucleosidase [Desulfoluna butyratoxydans]VFQ45680.1 nucleoside phosphorylase domain [Desulfoluna butyratoxydans]
MQISTIAVIMAMAEEAEPFIREMGLAPVEAAIDGPLPLDVYAGKAGTADLVLIVGGKDPRHGVDCVATQPATLAAYLAIERFKPDLLINAGTAGGFRGRGAHIGDVYLGSGCIRFHDRRIPIPGMDAYGVGSYPVPEFKGLARALGLKRGIISTGNSLDMVPEDLERLRANGADVKEMEAAAIAWVADLYHVPLLALKSVTDLVDTETPTQEEFLANLALASEALQEKLTAAIAYCTA